MTAAQPTAETACRLPWRAGLGWSALLLVATRVLLLALAPFAEPHKRPHFEDDHSAGYWWHAETRAAPFYEITPNIYLDMWARSDSWQYLQIATDGYYHGDEHGLVACFPLYPLLIRLGVWLAGGHELIVALAISNLSLWIAAALLYRLAFQWKGIEAARIATLGLFCFPSAFYLSTVFPHSLFLSLAVACVLAAGNGHLLLAGALAGLASATRTEGIALAPVLVIAHWRQQGLSFSIGSLGVLLAPLGLLAYCYYLWSRFDNPVAFLEVHAQFERRMSNPIATFLQPLWTRTFNIRHFVTYLSAAWLVVATYRRAPPLTLVFGWLLLAIPLATGSYESIYRVLATAFPIYLGLAAIRPRWIVWLQLVICALLQIAMCFWFIAGVRLN